MNYCPSIFPNKHFSLPTYFAITMSKTASSTYVEAHTLLSAYLSSHAVPLPPPATVSIPLDVLDEYVQSLPASASSSLVQDITTNTMRYVKIVKEVLDGLMDAAGVGPQRQDVPRELTRDYTVAFEPSKSTKERSIRSVGAKDIGALVSVRAIVTRVTDVKPLMTVACYTCDTCGFELYQPVESKTFIPLADCISEDCKKSKKGSSLLHMQPRGSKFEKFQEIRVQELPDQVPVGHVPRSMTIHAREDCTRKCLPGDVIRVDGVFLPIPYTGFRAIKAGLTCDTFLHAMSIHRNKINYSDIELNKDIEVHITSERSLGDDTVYNRLARSLAPEIFGLEDVKKALLLMLVGGVTQVFSDGMKIRGDLNLLMMGDPGVAKSQLLKHIATVAPRSVYTTGKGSSGVGLTAAVTRDQTSGEVVLEGGALVLADMGICCIDEFDKMEEADRTAIYEVMEQQTVSIAKAGITTTLNARTSILAAANPAYGRYNKKKNPSQNIDLPVALLSRFDLLFVMVDQAENDQDLALAHHVLYVHQHNHPRPLEFQSFSSDFIRAYVSKARTFQPVVPESLVETIIQHYTDLRNQHNDDQHLYCTPRTLLSILRLSQAAARLRFSSEVIQEDVDEAIRLFNAAKASTGENLDSHDVRAKKDPISVVYSIVKDRLGANNNKVLYQSLVSLVAARGYTETQLRTMLSQYKKISVLDYDSKNVWLTI